MTAVLIVGGPQHHPLPTTGNTHPRGRLLQTVEDLGVSHVLVAGVIRDKVLRDGLKSRNVTVIETESIGSLDDTSDLGKALQKARTTRSGLLRSIDVKFTLGGISIGVLGSPLETAEPNEADLCCEAIRRLGRVDIAIWGGIDVHSIFATEDNRTIMMTPGCHYQCGVSGDSIAIMHRATSTTHGDSIILRSQLRQLTKGNEPCWTVVVPSTTTETTRSSDIYVYSEQPNSEINCAHVHVNHI